MGVNKKSIQEILKRQEHSFSAIVSEQQITESELESFLLELLYVEVESLPKKVSNDRLKYIYCLLKYFNQGLDYLEYSLKQKTKIEKALNLLNNRTNSNSYNNTIRELFKDIQSSFVLVQVKNEVGRIDLDKEDGNDNLKQYINYLVFEAKKYEYLTAVIINNSIKLDQAPIFRKNLITKIFDSYVDSIITNNYYDIIYYERVVKLVLKYQQYLAKDIRLDFYQKLKYVLEQKELDPRREAFLISTIDIVCGNKKTDAKEAVNELNLKYLPYNVENGEINTVSDDDYVDMRDKKIITIDGAGTLTFDDALSFEVLPNGNYLLGIYTSNVADFIQKSSILDLAALNKGSSIYIPYNRVPMFPDYLSNHVFSLRQNEKHYAIAHLFEFNRETLELSNFDIKKAIIEVKKNYSYDLAERAYLRQNDEDHELMKNLFVFSEHLSIDRQNVDQYRGVKNILRDVKLDKEINTRDFNNSSASTVNSEYMIFLNQIIASKFSEHPELPFIYRINNSNIPTGAFDKLKSEIIKDKQVGQVVNDISKMYSQSYYSTRNTGHQGLSMPAYGHLGSPIRNYASLLSQRLEIEFFIKKNLADNIISGWDETLEPMVELLNKRREVNDIYIDEYNALHRRFKKQMDFNEFNHGKSR